MGTKVTARLAGPQAALAKWLSVASLHVRASLSGAPTALAQRLRRAPTAVRERLRPARLAADARARLSVRAVALALLVALPMGVQAVGLLPELTVRVPSTNDDAEHVLFVQGASEALSRGENPVDFWLPEMDEGFPWFLYYQNLPHLTPVALQRVLFGAIDVVMAFNLVRYVLLVGFPLTVFWSMRRMDFSAEAAAVSAATSTLLATPFLYGFEFESYLWRGFGLYTQIWAMHLSFITLAVLWRLLNYGTGFRTTVVVLALLGLSHLLYAYMMVVSAALLLVWGITRPNALARIGRLVGAGTLALVITSWMWLPYVLYRYWLNASPYLQPEKYTSYGAQTILGWLISGQLTDYGRLPVLLGLLALGVAAAVVTRRSAALFAVALFAVWLLLYFGRSTLGPLANVLPLQETLLFHRFIGGVHIAAIMLMGTGGAALFSLLRTRTSRLRTALAALTIAILLVPALRERWAFDDLNAYWMRQTRDAIAADSELASLLATLRDSGGGRVYAGLRSNWGERLDFALPFRSVRGYHYLASERFSMLAPPFGGASLNADFQFDFNDQLAAQYDLYDVRWVIAPRDVPFPSFLKVVRQTPRYTLYLAPSSGHAEYVALAAREAVTTPQKLFPKNRTFVNSAGPAQRTYFRWDYPAAEDRVLAGPAPGCERGEVRYERLQTARFDFLVSCPIAATLMVKETYHPNWRVTVDEKPVESFMVSPSYIGVSLPPGDHFVTVEYRSTPMKAPLLALGLAVIAGVVLGSGRAMHALQEGAARLRSRYEKDGLTARRPFRGRESARATPAKTEERTH